MTITKTEVNDRIEVLTLDAGHPVIQVRLATVIAENGVEISRTFHRRVLTPDADWTGEDAAVRAVAQAVFTDEARVAYANALKGTAPV